ncbi:type II toxin-antitoxin system VapC family toxin [Sphingomonas sp.]|uniref:type II toxin-antitoxin system VapC family toxin n=1 Tax=Sphingomonas sp. TaxID=28214 RepID=UPI002ED884AB
MILIDSSVWIDFFAARVTLQTLAVRACVRSERAIAIGDLVLTEVLQGARDEGAAAEIGVRLSEFRPVRIVDHRIAVQAARNYRLLRGKGITIRKTIDTLIATRCIVDDIPLLYSDRDFDPFVQHLGLRSALDDIGVN